MQLGYTSQSINQLNSNSQRMSPFPHRCTGATTAEFGTCGDTPQRHWRFSEAARACGARRFSKADAQQMLGGQLLVFAGDSIVRNLYGATLRLLGTPGGALWLCWGAELQNGCSRLTRTLPGVMQPH